MDQSLIIILCLPKSGRRRRVLHASLSPPLKLHVRFSGIRCVPAHFATIELPNPDFMRRKPGCVIPILD